MTIRENLMYLYVDEIKDIADKYALDSSGTKMDIINRILHFIDTGEKLEPASYPKVSLAKKGEVYPLDQNTLILKGSYKNNLETRLFFKQLIGPHFHFTAFGIDWIKMRWMEGNPPTYLEYAEMWEEEYKKRKECPAAAKEEWAYINFVQKYLDVNPSSSRDAVQKAWEEERSNRKREVISHLKSLFLTKSL